jgi:hypothetical protein
MDLYMDLWYIMEDRIQFKSINSMSNIYFISLEIR